MAGLEKVMVRRTFGGTSTGSSGRVETTVTIARHSRHMREIASLARNVPPRGKARHRVTDEPDDRRENHAADRAARRLADDDRADIDGVGRSVEQGNQTREEHSACQAAERADDRVADRAEVDVLDLRTDDVTSERASNELRATVDATGSSAQSAYEIPRCARDDSKNKPRPKVCDTISNRGTQSSSTGKNWET